MAKQPYPDPSPEQATAIAGNVRLVTEGFTELTGESLPPGRAGVIFLDGFIGRQRLRGDEAQRVRLADMAACYLGEAFIAEFGGRWIQHPEHGLGVELGPDLVAFPFNKATKHYANGADDSVLSYFETVSHILADQNRKAQTGAPPGL